MRCVLDTNVIVSGILSPHGHCGRIVDLLLEGYFSIVVDNRILAEYEEVLTRPGMALPQQDVRVLMDFIRSRAEEVVAEPLRATLPDAGDLPFLEVASSSECTLVTGNKRHFPSKACRSVRVLSAAEFMELLRRTPKGR